MKKPKKGPRDSENLPTFYASLLPEIREAGRKSGYAITIHGSMARDFDLVAVPWTRKAVSARALVRQMCRLTRTLFVSNDPASSDVKRPHGRRAWKLFFGGKPYLDLSIMPRAQDRLTN